MAASSRPRRRCGPTPHTARLLRAMAGQHHHGLLPAFARCVTRRRAPMAPEPSLRVPLPTDGLARAAPLNGRYVAEASERAGSTAGPPGCCDPWIATRTETSTLVVRVHAHPMVRGSGLMVSA